MIEIREFVTRGVTVTLHYSILSVHYLIKCSGWKRTFSYPNLKDDIFHQGQNFQTQSNIGTIDDDLLLDGRIGWIHEVACEVRASWLKCEWTPCRVLGRIC
jgi:hypothetical protein